LYNARQAAQLALASTADEREKSVALDELGDVAVGGGDLPAARKAFEESLAISKALADRDPGNTDCKRDLAIGLNKLGDVEVREGDLPAARKAFEDSLAISKALSVQRRISGVHLSSASSN
jgi:predicted negative regulator of RcsB-dependent stress response